MIAATGCEIEVFSLHAVIVVVGSIVTGAMVGLTVAAIVIAVSRWVLRVLRA